MQRDLIEPADPDLLCGGCGQNLRGVAADRCPECGQRFDRGRLLSVHVPWERRAHLGRMRAFGKTVVAVTFRPSLLIDPADNPLTLRAARGFRRRTVLALYVPALVVTWVWYSRQRTIRAGGVNFGGILNGYVPNVAELLLTPGFFYTTAVGVLLALFAVTGMASLFFAPRGLTPLQQQRGVAASLYANALLVWLVPLMGFASLGRSLVEYIDRNALPGTGAAVAFEWVAGGVAGAALLGWWLVPCRLLYGVTGSRGRVVVFAVAWPVLCVTATVGIVVGLLAVVNYVALVALTW